MPIDRLFDGCAKSSSQFFFQQYFVDQRFFSTMKKRPNFRRGDEKREFSHSQSIAKALNQTGVFPTTKLFWCLQTPFFKVITTTGRWR